MWGLDYSVETATLGEGLDYSVETATVEEGLDYSGLCGCGGRDHRVVTAVKTHTVSISYLIFWFSQNQLAPGVSLETGEGPVSKGSRQVPQRSMQCHSFLPLQHAL